MNKKLKNKIKSRLNACYYSDVSPIERMESLIRDLPVSADVMAGKILYI